MELKETYQHIQPLEYLDIFSKPQWYLELQPLLREFFYEYKGDKENKTAEWLEKRKELIIMVCELLKANFIALGDSGINWDKERLPIDTIVIHHSSTPPNTPVEAINALGLLRLYAPEYSKKEAKHYGLPLWSNHFYQNRPTCIAYHYVIKQDGSFEHILQDNEIGWHSGNWNYNCRSIALCFLDDVKEGRPTPQAMETAREIIKKYPNCTILGHQEVNHKTQCPGSLFLGDEGWKKEVLIKS